jgi:hypothetical protein
VEWKWFGFVRSREADLEKGGEAVECRFGYSITATKRNITASELYFRVPGSFKFSFPLIVSRVSSLEEKLYRILYLVGGIVHSSLSEV